MAIQQNGSLTTTNLVFAWDRDNPNSYKGPTIQNLASVIVPAGTSGTNILYTTGTRFVEIPTLGGANVSFVAGYNSNSGSYCCMQQFYYVTGNSTVACSPSTTYTYAIVYKCTSDYSHPNFMYRYEYNSGGTYQGEAGVLDTNKRINLGNGWYWAWNTFTTGASTALLSLRCFYYQYNVSDVLYIAKVMVTPGDYTTLNPKYWPDLGTTRSIASSMYDLTGTSTCNNGVMTFSGNGELSFNGSSNYISFAYNLATAPVNQVTFSGWAYLPNWDIGTGCRILSKTEGGGYQIALNENGVVTGAYLSALCLYGGSYKSVKYARSSLSAGWHEICCTCDGRYFRMYVDGVNVDTYDNGSVAAISYAVSNDFIIGGEAGNPTFSNSGYWPGKIANVLVYNRALSATEVLNNYNSLRKRFGL